MGNKNTVVRIYMYNSTLGTRKLDKKLSRRLANPCENVCPFKARETFVLCTPFMLEAATEALIPSILFSFFVSIFFLNGRQTCCRFHLPMYTYTISMFFFFFLSLVYCQYGYPLCRALSPSHSFCILEKVRLP